MNLTRFHTAGDRDFTADARFRNIQSEELIEYVVPQHWEQAAIDVLKDVFYPDALPALTRRVEETGVPEWLWRSEIDNTGLDHISAEWRYRMERDARQIVHRMAGALTYQGWKSGIFADEEEAKIFYDEYRYLLLHQIAAPELAQWRTLGLNWAYGLTEATPYIPLNRITAFSADDKNIMRRTKIMGETLALEAPQERRDVTLPVESAESFSFTVWKRDADQRQVAAQLGMHALETASHHLMDACDRDDESGFDPASNAMLGDVVDAAVRAGVSDSVVRRALHYAQQGYEEISFAPQEADRAAEDNLRAVLSLPDAFVESALTGHNFRSDAGRAIPAEKMWDALAEAVWASGEPAISFRSSIDSGHMLGSDADCAVAGGLAFVAGSAAPAATINLVACMDDAAVIHVSALRHAVQIMTMALDAASDIAGAGDKRPLMLGVTNMASLLMGAGLAYDSDAGRATAALVAGLVSGAALETSAILAARAGAFSSYATVAKQYLQLVKDKMAALSSAAFLQKGMTRRPVQIRANLCPDGALIAAVQQVWESAYALGRDQGFRHAHLTGIGAEAGVQNILGAQSCGIAPEAAQFFGKAFNPMVPRALARLGYGAEESSAIYSHALGRNTLQEAPFINHKTLRTKGFPQAAINAVESALGSALHIRYVFNKWTLGEDFCHYILGFSAEDLAGGTFDMLSALGFSEEEIETANAWCCGALSLEGAPHLKPQHLPVFDCAPRVSPEAQIKMQAMVETFLSGAAAHTILLPHETTIDDVQKLVLAGWEYGVKKLNLYREGCSLMNPHVGSKEIKNSQKYQCIEDAAAKISA